jgi:hypothetical protein
MVLIFFGYTNRKRADDGRVAQSHWRDTWRRDHCDAASPSVLQYMIAGGIGNLPMLTSDGLTLLPEGMLSFGVGE